MVWSETKKKFKQQLGHLRLQAIISGKSNQKRLVEYNITLERAAKFLDNLEKLNSFYDIDDSIEAVLDAAVFHLTAHYNLRVAKKGQPTEEQVKGYLLAIQEAYRMLREENQLLVKKIKSPVEYEIRIRPRICSDAFRLGAASSAITCGVITILVVALAAGPLCVPALVFGIVSLILGSVFAFTSVRTMKENHNIASGHQLDEITQFIDYLDGDESPIGVKRIMLENTPINDDVDDIRNESFILG